MFIKKTCMLNMSIECIFPFVILVKFMNHADAMRRDEEWSFLARFNNEQGFENYNVALQHAWDAFKEGRVPEGLRQSIHASWVKSHAAGIDPTHFEYQHCEEAKLAGILARNKPLITTAMDIMRNLLAYNPDGHINLTDANGITISFCGQDITPVGSILSEAVQGTNCTGRCLIEKRLVYLLSAENYKQPLREREKHCAAAPVRDENGVMIGVLSLTSDPGYFHYHTLGTVQAAAEAIAQQLILQRLVEEQKLVMESLNEGVIVTTRDGIIRQFNRYARQVLSFHEASIFLDVDDVLKPEGESLKTLPACKDRTVTFCPDGHARIPCLISIVITPEGGKVISLREARRVRDITHKVIGSSATYSFDMILGQSRVMQDIRNKARSASKSDSIVLLTGESGTGKELFAQSIHNSSPRSDGPFLALNCGAIPRDLVQSELFGFEDGVFTGSRRGGAAGKFELADGGTLFLDEIGDMPLEAQVNLLRVLQENEVMRIGGKRPLKINVRIIAATNRNLQKDVANGAFRRDLFFRLNVISLSVPPLRSRQEDIKELTNWFCEKICRALGRNVPTFSARTFVALQRHDWPGNVRELENVIERTLNMSESDHIDICDLPEEFKTEGQQTLGRNNDSTHLFRLKDGERKLIELCLIEKKGNLRQAAFALNLSRGALYNKLKRYGIDASDYRDSR